MHPRLAELERLEAEAATEPTPDETPVSEVVVADVEPTPVEVTPVVEAREEEDHFLKIDKRQPYQSLRQLAEQEKAVKDAIETMVGRKSKAKYAPELEALKAERDALLAEKKRLEFQKLTDAEVSQRFGADPQFAKEYTEAVHAKPVDVEAIRQANEIRAMFHQDIERAESAGVAPERVAQIENWLASGAFDKHQGQVLTPIQSYRWFRDVIDQDIRMFQGSIQPAARTPETAVAAQAPVAVAPAPAVEEKRAPTPNLRLQEASPDLSASSHASGGIQRMSREEWRRMTPPERHMRWPVPGDFEREVNAGLFTD